MTKSGECRSGLYVTRQSVKIPRKPLSKVWVQTLEDPWVLAQSSSAAILAKTVALAWEVHVRKSRYRTIRRTIDFLSCQVTRVGSTFACDVMTFIHMLAWPLRSICASTVSPECIEMDSITDVLEHKLRAHSGKIKSIYSYPHFFFFYTTIYYYYYILNSIEL